MSYRHVACDYNVIADDIVRRARSAGQDITYDITTVPSDAPIFNPMEVYTYLG